MARIPSLLRYALEAQAKGFHIFPVEPGDKLPARLYQERDPKDAPWRLKWGDAATNDVNKIVEWWTYAPMCNIGIACKPSGLFVVDCDRPKENDLLKGTPWERPGDGPRVDGEVAFFRVAERYGREDAWQAFDTYQVATGSGGRHFYYRWPTAVQSSQESPVKGLLDVRGNGGEKGGYVLGAGSITPKGRYEADTSCPEEVAPAPDWLVALCKYREPYRPPKPPFRQPRVFAVHGLLETVRNAPDGNLNNAMFWAARAACNDGFPIEETVKLLADEYVQLGGNGGYRQAEATIRSAYRAQERKMG
jgi:hypothetical protein